MNQDNAYSNFWGDILASQIVSENKDSLEYVFLEERCRFLVEQEVLQDYHIVRYNNNDSNIRVDAWGFLSGVNDGTASIALIVSDFHETNELESQTMTEFRSFLMKGKRFYMQSLKEDFRFRILRPDTPEACLADYLFLEQESLFSIQIIGLTNSKIISKKNSLVISENTVQNICFSYDIWDFERFNKIDCSSNGRESVNIDFVNDYEISEGISTLWSKGNCPEVSSYLFVLPGEILTKMYETWNERLLEQNPRTFLQFSGKVNKGIRNTLFNEPEKFFSYNNGISAVASHVILNEKNGITQIENFQIVNGGQTTASIYNTFLQSKKSKKELQLDKISVMVKLSVIENADNAEEIIPKISEYSNTQNPVKSSAFSVRHPFHKVLEDYSRNLWTPAQQGRMESHWYYERVLGQYRNALNLCHSKTERNTFEQSNPKNQMIKKEELAKYLLTFDGFPQKVCLGSQKCYAVFCNKYLKTDDDNQGFVDSKINEAFFIECCAKAILFRSLEKKASQGIRFVLVPYTLALVSEKLKDHGYVFDFVMIWKNQWNNELLINLLTDISQLILEKLKATQPLETSLLSEWGKKDQCLQLAKNCEFSVQPFFEFCLTSSQAAAKKTEAASLGREDRKIDCLTDIVEKGENYWRSLEQWGFSSKLIATASLSIIRAATQFNKKLPTDKQAQAIQKIEKKALEDGFFFKG
jgi:hypothetical protein